MEQHAVTHTQFLFAWRLAIHLQQRGNNVADKSRRGGRWLSAHANGKVSGLPARGDMQRKVSLVTTLRNCQCDSRQVLTIKRPIMTEHLVQNNTKCPCVARVRVSACAASRTHNAGLGKKQLVAAGLYTDPHNTSGARYNGVPGVRCHIFSLRDRVVSEPQSVCATLSLLLCHLANPKSPSLTVR
jgi:hypothetical protein